MDSFIKIDKDVVNKVKNVLLIILCITCVALIMSTTCAKRKLDISENNLKAATDTLHVYEMKNGELMYEKQGYILKIDELENSIGITKKEAKELEKKLNSALSTISKLQGQVRIDTVRMTDSVYVTPEGIYHNKFSYSDLWVDVNGESTFGFNPFQTQTTLNEINMRVPLKVGTTEDNKWFAVSENPYVSFSSVEGANMEKAKQKKWSVGIQLGVGALVGYGVSVGNGFNPGIIIGGGLYGGIGLTYKLIDF
jgi:hypothetical protein